MNSITNKALDAIVVHRIPVFPVFGHSRSVFIPRDNMRYANCDACQLDRWTEKYPDCNWAMATGKAARLIVLEIQVEFCQPIVNALCGGEWGWHESLQFHSGPVRYFVFRHPDVPLRKFDLLCSGILLHSEHPVLVPPSSFVSSPSLEFMDVTSAIQDCPAWLCAGAPGHILSDEYCDSAA